MTRAVAVTLATLISIAVTTASVGPAPPALPGRLEQYLAHSVKLTPDERRMLTSGAPVTKLLPADGSKEVAVFGAIWIDAPMHRYVEAVEDIERFESGDAFKVTRRVSTPPRVEDFAEMHLSDEDIEDLRTCRVGECEVKLGQEALRRFRTEIDWKAPGARAAADGLMQQVACAYVTGYLEGGNERLAVYRDKERPTFVAREFREMVDRMPELTTYMPNVRRYLLEYPRVLLPGSSSFVYWQETEFGLKPTLRISHLTILEGPAETVVASKMLYASHYFWTGLELRVLLAEPARGQGFWLVTVNRSRSDGLSGFTGHFVRGRVRSEVQEGSLAALRMTKKRLEGS